MPIRSKGAERAAGCSCRKCAAARRWCIVILMERRTPPLVHALDDGDAAGHRSGAPIPFRQHQHVDDQVFDENRTDVTIKLGDTEEWTILNQDSQYHDLHIHQTGFLVTEVNGIPTRFDGLRDTFSVPPSKYGKPGSAKLIIPFTSPEIVGRFVFHCHLAKHEDKGMMQVVEVMP